MPNHREKRTILASDIEKMQDCPIINIEVIPQSASEGSKKTYEISIQDINTSGMGITCETPLEVGQTVSFIKAELPWDLPEKGHVMWIFKVHGAPFRAGIKFI